jgi:hypothetical protein
MKKVRYVCAATFGLIALAGVAQADPDTTDSATVMTSPEDAPTVHYDPDGVPLAVTEKQPRRATPEQIAAYRKEMAKAAADKDWLLRAYEKQLQTHEAAGTTATEFSNANPYAEFSANKDLAKLAGLPDLQDDDADEKPLPRTGNDASDHSSAGLHPGSSPLSTRAPASQPFGSSFLRPMITPLSAPDAAGLSNFYSSLPVAGLTPYYATDPSTPAPPVPARASVVPDDTADHDIDTPGMIAAEKDPLADPNTSDLTLDVLPGESVEHAKAHQDNTDALLQLPQAMDADEFHRAQESELNPPVPKNALANQSAAPTPAPPKPADDYDAPVPISKFPTIAPVHAPIANPYDILNR